MENKKITWYPGHMLKAKKEVQAILKTVNLVIEIIDSRVPISSHNDMLDDLTKNKEKIIVFTKKDLVEEKELIKFKKIYEKNNYKVISMNLHDSKGYKKLVEFIEKQCIHIKQKYLDKGLNLKVRGLVIGMPNVGKSTFINYLAKKKKLVAANKPGITKNQQIISINEDIELIDTPGILVPKIEKLDTAYNLIINSLIKNDIVELQDVGFYLLKYLINNYFKSITHVYNDLSTYNTFDIDFDNAELEVIEKLYEKLSMSMGISIKNEIDYERITVRLINDYRNQKFGKIILDNYEI